MGSFFSKFSNKEDARQYDHMDQNSVESKNASDALIANLEHQIKEKDRELRLSKYRFKESETRHKLQHLEMEEEQRNNQQYFTQLQLIWAEFENSLSLNSSQFSWFCSPSGTSRSIPNDFYQKCSYLREEIDYEISSRDETWKIFLQEPNDRMQLNAATIYGNPNSEAETSNLASPQMLRIRKHYKRNAERSIELKTEVDDLVQCLSDAFNHYCSARHLDMIARDAFCWYEKDEDIRSGLRNIDNLKKNATTEFKKNEFFKEFDKVKRVIVDESKKILDTIPNKFAITNCFSSLLELVPPRIRIEKRLRIESRVGIESSQFNASPINPRNVTSRSLKMVHNKTDHKLKPYDKSSVQFEEQIIH